MTQFHSLAKTAEARVSVEQTLDELGYDSRYINVIKRLFGIIRTPVSKQTPTEFLTNDGNEHIEKMQSVRQITYTHTGQETYPFGRSCLIKLSRISGAKAALVGSTASNCVSTFKVMDMHKRSRNKQRHAVVTCDTVFTNILREIPNTTVAGDAKSYVYLGGDGGDYKIVHVESQTYSEHFGGAWEETASKTIYEKNYNDRIVNLIVKTIELLHISEEQSITILPHNVNMYTWKAILKKIDRKNTELFSHGITDNGHCFGSDAFLNLQLYQAALTIQNPRADYLFCVTAGVGGFFSTMVLEANRGLYSSRDNKKIQVNHEQID